MEQINGKLKYVQMTVGCVGVIGNLLVCLTIVKTKSMHNVTNFLLLNLASVDACVSIMTVLGPFFGVVFASKIGIFGYCTPSFIYNFNCYFLINCILRSMFSSSILSLSLATFERYIGIIHPFKHSSFFTRRKIIILLCFVWMVPILCELPVTVAYMFLYAADNCTVPKNNKYPTLLVTGVVNTALTIAIPSIVLAFMYIKIMVNLKTGARRLEEQGVQGPPQELYRAFKKVTQALSIVIAAFFILIMPAQIIRLIKISLDLFGGNYAFSNLFTCITVIASTTNSAINPIVYGFKYTQLRRAFIAIICPCSTRCNRSNQVQQQIEATT